MKKTQKQKKGIKYKSKHEEQKGKQTNIKENKRYIKIPVNPR